MFGNSAVQKLSEQRAARSNFTQKCSHSWRLTVRFPGWMTTIGSDHTHRLATQHRRRSPPNWISNGLLRYALRAPLRSPLLQPSLCAKQPPGSNPSWGKAGGHVMDSICCSGRSMKYKWDWYGSTRPIGSASIGARWPWLCCHAYLRLVRTGLFCGFWELQHSEGSSWAWQAEARVFATSATKTFVNGLCRHRCVVITD